MSRLRYCALRCRKVRGRQECAVTSLTVLLCKLSSLRVRPYLFETFHERTQGYVHYERFGEETLLHTKPNIKPVHLSLQPQPPRNHLTNPLPTPPLCNAPSHQLLPFGLKIYIRDLNVVRVQATSTVAIYCPQRRARHEHVLMTNGDVFNNASSEAI